MFRQVPVYLRKEETIFSEAVDTLTPGEWVTLISISEDGKMSNVMTQKEKPVSGYIPTELLYADPEEGLALMQETKDYIWTYEGKI